MSEQFEVHIRKIAKNMPYPAEVSRQTTRRQHLRFAWQYLVVILLLVGLTSMGIPEIRAAVLEFLRIGAVTVYLDGKDANGQALNLSQVSGETSLEDAGKQANFTLLVPPDDLPDRVFVQDANMIIFVWLKDNRIDKALYQTANDTWRLSKMTSVIERTEVAGNQAYWASDQVTVQFSKEGVIQNEWTHFVDGNVLGWEQDGVTYRLETNLSLDEARAFAEGMRPLQ